ncbi:NADH-quinone oxidoreductase subunit J family protein [Flavobacterium croceum]|uniref:NADH-quinone oxidoreductase subunit J n=1 Tax=Flavobacterium croceum DSM 17960 TaxID=1121886 RepID=A0A2S4N892_9FLAO|nr:NADH-quinone oxidoreductase subunit J [Flavobacterium croceum]POS01922.1 NADH dehydrogenase subunit J [Flavobacterium croceum DSM 17960]
MSTVLIIFYILSAITLSMAFLAVFTRNPIHSAIYLVVCMMSIGGHFLLFNSQFLAIVQIIVYAGAIMVLILYTIMLMDLNKEHEVHRPRVTRLVAIILFSLTCIILILIFINSDPVAGTIDRYDNFGEDFQSIKKLGKVLLNEYLVPFEYASILLLTAMIGAVLLSKKEKPGK